MPLQSSGPISLGQIQSEFGGANPTKATEYYRNASYTTSNNTNVPTSGKISLSNFYGTRRAVYGCTDPRATNYNSNATDSDGSCSYPPPPPPPPPPSASFSASPSSIVLGNSSSLSWSTSGATNVSISNVGTVGTSGNTVVSPSTTTTYTLTGTGPSGTVTTSATVTVTIPPSCSEEPATSEFGYGFTGYLKFNNNETRFKYTAFITRGKSGYEPVANVIINAYNTIIGRYPEGDGFDYWVRNRSSYPSDAAFTNAIRVAYENPGQEKDYNNSRGGLKGNYNNCDDKKY